ncbi:hypothetical protein K9N68_11100 [Kovacikia minuta CCNUW1]|uniref:hypothetical protein n=1 Tax=Kovacikia minuta TaxID=2931930 RepID=UPI001CCEE8F4|nr:hypothetical protein [Kovacikia minuta]UBF28371.1 hypothetical protein K9N68_11100 [Kovacikia minuta CCNUW1]
MLFVWGCWRGVWRLPPRARADIPVTGGRATGDAAFFLPGTNAPTGSPILFDTAIRTLRIVTPNGTTTTSRFIPNAASFTDTNGNKLPDSGDTGKLAGVLSGVAFSPNGGPVFFQGIPTTLNFTLNSFSPSFLQGGTLISPQQAGTAPLVFLPVTNVSLSSQSSSTYSTQEGVLEAGPFDAKLTGNFIGLPSNLQFRASSETVLPVVLGRRIKFDFEGKDVTPDSATFDDDTLDFSGQTTKFKVQSVGTPGTREFKIEGTAGNLDIRLTSPFEIKKNDLINVASPLDYSIKGEGPGYVALGNSSVSFTGTSRRDTQFKFEQGDRKFEGKSGGNVAFRLTTGGDDRTDFTPFVGVNNDGTDFTSGSSSSSSTGGTTTSTTTVVTTTQVTNISFTNFVSSTTYIRLFNPSLLVVNTNQNNNNQGDDDRDDDIVYGNLTYTIYKGSIPVIVVIERDSQGRIIFVERERGRGRALGRKRRVVAAYQEVGLPSRVFPGLVGLKQIPPDQVTTDSGDTTTTPGTTTTPDSTTTPGTTTTPDSTTTPGTTTTP